MFGFEKKKALPVIQQSTGDARPIIGVTVLGMAHIIRGRGEGTSKIESVIGPIWEIVRQNTPSDEKAMEVINWNLEQAFTMPAEAIPGVIQSLADQMSMTAKREVGITLMWYSAFTDNAAGSGDPMSTQARDAIIKLYLRELGIPDREHSTLKIQASQRLSPSQTPPPSGLPGIQIAPELPRARVQTSLAPVQSIQSTSTPARNIGNGPTIDSPMNGVFYDAPYPDAGPYVSVGSKVNPDSIVCKVNVKNAYYEIKAGMTGEIASILRKNGDSIAVDQPLFILHPVKAIRATSMPPAIESRHRQQAGLPEHPELRRDLLGVVVANLALEANLKSANRAHELGDPKARHDGLVEVVQGILKRFGPPASRDVVEGCIAMIKAYLTAYGEGMSAVIGNLQDPDALVNSLKSAGAVEGIDNVRAAISITGQINSRLPEGLKGLSEDDATIIEAAVAQGKKAAEM